MFKNFILIMLLTLGTMTLSQTSQRWLTSSEIKTIDAPKWSLVAINSDGTVVTWGQKYGLQKIDTCIGLWESNRQYLLTWKDGKKVELQKQNVTNLRYHKK